MPFSFAGLMYLMSGVFCVAVQCVDHGDHENIVEVFVTRPDDPEETQKKSGS